MSLRTKLIAAVVGLPGAILLLAIVLFSREGRSTPPEALDAIIKLAREHERAVIGPGVLEQVRARHFKAAYVLKDPGTNAEAHPREVWTVEAFYARDRQAQPDVQDAAAIEALFESLGQARKESPPLALRSDFLAVGARQPDDDNRSYGFVMHLHGSGRAAETVYWVMIAGIALLVIVFTYLIARWVIRPLDKLSAAADRIAEGDFEVQVEAHGSGDEFGRTIRALNRMASEIGEYQGQLEDRVLGALSRIKKAEQHLAIAQRLAATGKLASGLAHEINNPLGGMKNAVRALARGDMPPEKTDLYLDLITDGLARIEQTVKKFLTFTPRRAQPRPTDLVDVTSKSVDLAMHRIRRRGIEILTDFPEDASRAIVFGDPHELQQVALNLVLNAADAIPEDRADGQVRVEIERRGEDVVLRVADNGSGMSAEDQDRCFDMFFTTKEVGEGSGMGLAVVHNIVTNHGGRIELTSQPGAGTIFDVILPGEGRAEGRPEALVTTT
ncbi:MAG: HAMP domain-containing sensor histidine kinase [Planctomycetota bacterium]|nr:HAMP domain-containing sensor histidine kinase [Planctomycetota bacterium]